MKGNPAASQGSRLQFPIRDRYTVSGFVLGDLCFSCICRVIELNGDEGMVLAWCDGGWPDDAHQVEVLAVAGTA